MTTTAGSDVHRMAAFISRHRLCTALTEKPRLCGMKSSCTSLVVMLPSLHQQSTRHSSLTTEKETIGCSQWTSLFRDADAHTVYSYHKVDVAYPVNRINR